MDENLAKTILKLFEIASNKREYRPLKYICERYLKYIFDVNETERQTDEQTQFRYNSDNTETITGMTANTEMDCILACLFV